MMREYKVKGGKVTVCPTKYNNDSVNVNSNTSKGRVIHYRNRQKLIMAGVCEENTNMKYYK